MNDDNDINADESIQRKCSERKRGKNIYIYIDISIAYNITFQEEEKNKIKNKLIEHTTNKC